MEKKRDAASIESATATAPAKKPRIDRAYMDMFREKKTAYYDAMRASARAQEVFDNAKKEYDSVIEMSSKAYRAMADVVPDFDADPRDYLDFHFTVARDAGDKSFSINLPCAYLGAGKQAIVDEFIEQTVANKEYTAVLVSKHVPGDRPCGIDGSCGDSMMYSILFNVPFTSNKV